MSVLTSSTHYGKPVEAGGYNLIPIARAHQIRPRGVPLGLRWERPIGVLVQDLEGEEFVLPIQDVTRRIQIAVFLLASAGWFFLSRRGSK
jgi:hypothetical protein